MATATRLSIDRERLMADIRELGAIGADTGSGITRRAFSDVYQQACHWLEQQMQAAGLTTRVDAVGNLIGRMGPEEGPVVMTGSHIDTVRSGGPLDGALGVLAGLEVARVLRHAGCVMKRPFEVVAFIDEEGVYLSLLGSMALAGCLAQNDLERAFNAEGRSLTNALRESGFNPDAIADAAYPPGAIQSFIELHIEQGPALEERGVQIGIVDGVVSQRNVDYCFSGKSNHAGTTPMDMRRDALRGAADFVSEAYRLLPQCSTASTRITFGTITVEPNASNVIARQARVRMDQRDLDEVNSQALANKVHALAEEVAGRYGLDLTVEEKCFNPAAHMSPALMQTIQEVVDDLGYRAMVMPSGAGHDAQSMATICDTGMIFVPSIGGLSHHPDEWTDPADIERGANVLLRVLHSRLVGDATGFE